MNTTPGSLPTTTRGGPAPRGLTPDAAWRALHAQATAPYLPHGRFAYHFARGKLSRDPVFRAMLERGSLPPGARIVDIGCGQGLIASLCWAIDAAVARGTWPAAWGPAPTGCRYTGIELMPRDVARAQAASTQRGDGAAFVCGDMRTTPLPACDVVVILDVMHYVDHAAQEAVLAKVRDALAPAGRLLIRVGDQSSTRGFAASQWVDRVVTMIRGHRVPPTYGRPLSDWIALLERLGFQVSALPMSQGTPFANVLLDARLGGGSAGEAAR